MSENKWSCGRTNIFIDAKAILRHDGQDVMTIQWDVRETLYHFLLKLVVAAHLLNWGYKPNDIEYERTFRVGKDLYRADIFCQKKAGSLLQKPLWFECGETSVHKLKNILKLTSNRVIWVIDAIHLIHAWNGKEMLFEKNTHLLSEAEKRILLKQGFRLETWRTKEGEKIRFWDDINNINDLSLTKEEKKLLLNKNRKILCPLGVEIWGLSFDIAKSRILYALRRDIEENYTFFETGEGWSLSGFGYISKKKHRIVQLGV